MRATTALSSVGKVPPFVSQRTSVVAPASAAARSTASAYGIVAEAVEVVLGVEDDLFAGQVGDGVAHGLEVLLGRGPQDLLHVQLPALGDDAGDGREREGRSVTAGSSSALPFGRRARVKATSFAWESEESSKPSKNSRSLGLEAGKPASM